MRRSLRQAIKHLLESTGDQVCPRCAAPGQHPSSEVLSANGASHDRVKCETCGFEWQSAFRIVLSPVVPNPIVAQESLRNPAYDGPDGIFTDHSGD